MNSIFLAQYLVNRFGHVPGGVTPLKLQKLLYYVKAWGLVENEDLVDGHFERWTHGPVNREVYNFFRTYGRAPIQPKSLGWDQEPQGQAREFVEFIGTSYAYIPAVELSALTHREAPWRHARPNERIDEKLMASYYAKHPFARNLPFDPIGKPYYPVQTGLRRAFVMDMAPQDAERAGRYASFEAYRDHLKRLEQQGLDFSGGWLSRLMA